MIAKKKIAKDDYKKENSNTIYNFTSDTSYLTVFLPIFIKISFSIVTAFDKTI